MNAPHKCERCPAMIRMGSLCNTCNAADAKAKARAGDEPHEVPAATAPDLTTPDASEVYIFIRGRQLTPETCSLLEARAILDCAEGFET